MYCIVLKNRNMSKIEELRQKYPQISSASFKKFTEADKTPTKKYLDFMLKAWEDRKNPSVYYRTTGTIISAVNKFNDLLPFISNKDIYSKEYYNDLGKLHEVVKRAEELKEEKSFVREDHANVILETDEFLFVQPKTHRGSVKYGANTKWCTTGKNDPATFNRYFKNGLLVYLIDKTKTKSDNFQKVAFYHEYGNKALNDIITIYAVNDSIYTESHMMNAGWGEYDLLKIFTNFRYYFSKVKEIKKNKDFVDSFVNTISQLDFTKFEEHLTKLDESSNISYIKEVQKKVESFIESLNKTKYGLRKTEN